MSEPMSSGEIEDVLSSIRRLVSEDLRPSARASAQPPEAAPQPRDPADKLLLTPALRVVADTTMPPQNAAIDTSRDPETQQAAFQSVRTAAPAADAVSAVAAAMGRDAVQDEDGDDAPPAAVPQDWDDAEAGFVDIGEDDAFLLEGQGNTSSQPVAFAPLDPDQAWGVAAQDQATVAPVDAETPDADDWLPENDQDLDPHWQAEEADVLDDTSPVAQAPTWADAAEAEVLRELSSEPEPETGFGRIGGPDDPVYDEDLLRELVRDILREELQGALGERITRNVRKLVRAEIARALAVRDFE